MLHGARGPELRQDPEMALPPDIQIAQGTPLQPIEEIGAKLGLESRELRRHGNHVAKLEWSAVQRAVDRPEQGKLVLVTALTATRAGAGKTVTTIGLAQSLHHLGIRSCAALREPSLGPVFGIKGGAAGGGYAQVLPMEDINLHFTGDLHAVGSAHNLLAAVTDNHAHFGTLPIDRERIVWRRVMDLCDRQLRNIEVGLGHATSGFPHASGFDITASSEVMAVLALSRDRDDLRQRLGRMIVAWDAEGKAPVEAEQTGAVGAMEILLRDALLPNLVQTVEGAPALVHCGPFANIAHGCNSVVATRTAMGLADVVVTEAGFGADLGAEKFLHLKGPVLGSHPAGIVLVVTVRALKMHGGVAWEDLGQENVEAVRTGYANARVHLENLRRFGIPVVVAINVFPTDTEAELGELEQCLQDQQAEYARSYVAARGGPGGEELARKVLTAIEPGNREVLSLYEGGSTVVEKVETLARVLYRADGVDLTDEALADLEVVERLGAGRLPVCVAKTQHSLSDDPKAKGAPTDWRLTVRGFRVSRGAGFVVALTGKILLMPGMPREPSVFRMGVGADGRVFGLD